MSTTYDGKRKRQRFNEDIDETLSRNSQMAAKKAYSLTKNSLHKFNQGSKGGNTADDQSTLISKATSKLSSVKSNINKKQ